MPINKHYNEHFEHRDVRLQIEKIQGSRPFEDCYTEICLDTLQIDYDNFFHNDQRIVDKYDEIKTVCKELCTKIVKTTYRTYKTRGIIATAIYLVADYSQEEICRFYKFATSLLLRILRDSKIVYKKKKKRTRRKHYTKKDFITWDKITKEV